jgi:hypothetical protein
MMNDPQRRRWTWVASVTHDSIDFVGIGTGRTVL